MRYKCRFCETTFINKSRFRQHTNSCNQHQSSGEESTDVNDMSLDSEEFTNVSEVKLIN